MKNPLALLALVLVLTACASEPPPAPRADYVLPPKILLDVQTLNLMDRSGLQPTNSPYNNNNFQPTITQAIRQWAKDRLQAVGPVGEAVVIIKDASLQQQTIPYEHDLFTRQQASKYVAHAEVDVEAKGREGYALASAQASRFETLPENPSDAERQKAYFNVLNGLMRDLGQNLESSMQEHLRDFVVTAPVLESGFESAPAAPAATFAPAP